jgi:hypothetical protein
VDGGIGPSQGLYIKSTAQRIKTRTCFRASSGNQTHNPSVQVVQDGTDTGISISEVCD